MAAFWVSGPKAVLPLRAKIAHSAKRPTWTTDLTNRVLQSGHSAYRTVAEPSIAVGCKPLDCDLHTDLNCARALGLALDE